MRKSPEVKVSLTEHKLKQDLKTKIQNKDYLMITPTILASKPIMINPPLRKKKKVNEQINLINQNNIHSKVKVNENLRNLSQPFEQADIVSNMNNNYYRFKKNLTPNNLDANNNYFDLQKATWNSKSSNKPSDKISKIKVSDPFAVGKKHQTNFGYVYSAGGIPCRIEHGNVRLKLKWDIDPDKLDYDPILLICFEGLLETNHPYNFAAKQCVREMLQANGAMDKVIPILSKLIAPLRQALGSKSADVFSETIEITQMLSNLVREKLNPFLHFILQPINKRSFEMKYKEKVFDVLRILEINGGEDALKVIKNKIPTYVTSI